MPKRDVTLMPFSSFYPAYVNKVGDELARGKKMESILRKP